VEGGNGERGRPWKWEWTKPILTWAVVWLVPWNSPHTTRRGSWPEGPGPRDLAVTWSIWYLTPHAIWPHCCPLVCLLLSSSFLITEESHPMFVIAPTPTLSNPSAQMNRSHACFLVVTENFRLLTNRKTQKSEQREKKTPSSVNPSNAGTAATCSRRSGSCVSPRQGGTTSPEPPTSWNCAACAPESGSCW
jgi:hypothetical protein